MRRWGLIGIVIPVLAGCAAPLPPSPPPLPFEFAGARGSAVGNYQSVQTEAAWIDERGVSCTVFIWDRPISGGRAIRLTSASCPVGPGIVALRDLGRTVIPLDQSALIHLPPPEPLPADPITPTAPVPRVTPVGH